MQKEKNNVVVKTSCHSRGMLSGIYDVQSRFIKQGLDGFEDHNILELILFFAIPRRDTNVIAHNLLSKFGSFSRVFEASVDELCSDKEKEEKFELNIFLVGTSRKCSV